MNTFGPNWPEAKGEASLMSDEKMVTGQLPEQETAPVLPMKLAVSVRPVEPKGNLVGFASLRINDCFVIDDFRVLQNDKGIYVGMPSKPDKSSKTGYRDTARPVTKEFRTELTEAVTTAYHEAIEKLQVRAAAIPDTEKPSIQKQLADGGKQAAKDNVARPAFEKGEKVNNAER